MKYFFHSIDRKLGLDIEKQFAQAGCPGGPTSNDHRDDKLSKGQNNIAEITDGQQHRIATGVLIYFLN